MRPKQLTTEFQKSIFPESDQEAPWQEVDQVKRHYLMMPFYPFRTLCPRDLASFPITRTNEITNSSPIFPAHTQIDITFKKRNVDNFLKFMLPCNLEPSAGTSASNLTADQNNSAKKFSIVTINAANERVTSNYQITNVNIVLTDLFLPVSFFNYIVFFYNY